MILWRRGPEYLHEREPLVRPYEKVLLALIALLLAALAVAILSVRATTTTAAAPTEPAAADQPSGDGRRDLLRAPASSGTGSKDEPSGSRREALFPCSSDERLLFEPSDARAGTGGGADVGLAVDPYGRFALYGAADGRSGEPTGESHDLLRGCAPGATPSNRVAVRVEGFYPPGRAAGAGRRTVARETHREAGEPDTLVTLFRFRGGIVLEQRLSVAEGPPDEAALHATYRLANVSGETRKVGLRSVLAPPPASPGAPASVPDFVVDGAGVDRELELVGPPGEVRAPRPAVPTDSGGLWRPEIPAGVLRSDSAPDRVVLAGVPDLVEGRMFRPRIDEGRDLPNDAAIGVYWLGRELGPGEVLTLAHSYGPAASFDPRKKDGGAIPRKEGENEMREPNEPSAGETGAKGAS